MFCRALRCDLLTLDLTLPDMYFFSDKYLICTHFLRQKWAKLQKWKLSPASLSLRRISGQSDRKLVKCNLTCTYSSVLRWYRALKMLMCYQAWLVWIGFCEGLWCQRQRRHVWSKIELRTQTTLGSESQNTASQPMHIMPPQRADQRTSAVWAFSTPFCCVCEESGAAAGWWRDECLICTHSLTGKQAESEQIKVEAGCGVAAQSRRDGGDDVAGKGMKTCIHLHDPFGISSEHRRWSWSLSDSGGFECRARGAQAFLLKPNETPVCVFDYASFNSYPTPVPQLLRRG